MCQERPQDCDRYLPAVLFAYREVPRVSTGFSPFELLYDRTVRGLMQVLKELWTGNETPEVRNTYLNGRHRLEETCELVRKNLRDAGPGMLLKHTSTIMTRRHAIVASKLEIKS